MHTGTSGHPPASPHDAMSHARSAQRGGLWHWLMFAVLLLTVPAFYLQLDAVEPAWRKIGAALYAFVAAAFLVDLAYRRRVRRDHDRIWNIWLDAALIVGTAASALSCAFGRMPNGRCGRSC